MKVVSICGIGRSGSTLLERTLGEFPGWVAVGEPLFVFRAAFQGELCSCGTAVANCHLWSRVLDDLLLRARVDDLEEAECLLRGLARHRRLPYLVRVSTDDGALVRALEILRVLFTAVRDHTGASVIVESSKSPPWAYMLRRALPSSHFVIHLVRDSRGVAFSEAKLIGRRDSPGDTFPVHPVWRSALRWLYMNASAASLRRSGPWSRVRYEDLMADPVREVLRLARSVEPELTPDLSFLSDDRVTLAPHHGIAGNPVRFDEGSIEIANDCEWQDKMSLRERSTVTLLTAPLLLAYRYRLAT